MLSPILTHMNLFVGLESHNGKLKEIWTQRSRKSLPGEIKILVDYLMDQSTDLEILYKREKGAPTSKDKKRAEAYLTEIGEDILRTYVKVKRSGKADHRTMLQNCTGLLRVKPLSIHILPMQMDEEWRNLEAYKTASRKALKRRTDCSWRTFDEFR